MKNDVELSPGSTCMAYIKDKWRPAKFITNGRKWATVQLNGATKNNHIPCDAVRPIKNEPTTSQPIKTVAAPGPEPRGYHLIERDGHTHIRRGDRSIAVMLPTYRQEAEVMLKALQQWTAEQVRTQNS